MSKRQHRTTCPWCPTAITGTGWLALEDARAEHYQAAHGIRRKLHPSAGATPAGR